MQVNYLIILLLSLCSLSLYPQIAGKDLEVTSNKVFYDSKNEIIEFSGEPANIEIFFPEQIKGSAENIVFNPTSNIKLLGNAILLTDELNLNSDEITYSLSTE